MFATRSYGGVVRRDVGGTGIGWATRAARRWGLMVTVYGRGGLVLRPRCVSGAVEIDHTVSACAESGEADMNCVRGRVMILLLAEALVCLPRAV